MTTATGHPASTAPDPGTPVVKKRRAWLAPLVAGVVGLGIGGVAGHGWQQTAAPVPGPTVTYTSEVTVPGPTTTATVEDKTKLDAAKQRADAIVRAAGKMTYLAGVFQVRSFGALRLASEALVALDNGETARYNDLRRQLQAEMVSVNAAKHEFDLAVVDYETVVRGGPVT